MTKTKTTAAVSTATADALTTRFATKRTATPITGTTTLGAMLATYGKIVDGGEVSVTFTVTASSVLRVDQVPSRADATDKAAVLASMSQATQADVAKAQAVLEAFDAACKAHAKARLAGETREVWTTRGHVTIA
jgi:hypothetical protein